MRAHAAFLLSLGLAGCGYVGAPLPPALNVPEKIADLRGIQRGDRIEVAFTPTLMSTDRILMKEIAGIELRAGPIPEGEFNFDRWLTGSVRTPDVPAQAEFTEAKIPIGNWAGRNVLVAVRAIGPSGRPSEWSNYLTLFIVPPPVTPSGVRADAHPQGAVLEWERGAAPADASWRIFRRGPDDQEAVLMATARDPRWVDPGAVFGKTYLYRVQTVVPASEGVAESPLSAPAEVTPVDRFPPEPPAGLTAIAGVNSIELTWDRCPEPDAAGYLILRGAGSEALVQIAGPVPQPAFSDQKVESGKRYRYAIAAVDERGNTSAPGAPVEIAAP